MGLKISVPGTATLAPVPATKIGQPQPSAPSWAFLPWPELPPELGSKLSDPRPDLIAMDYSNSIRLPIIDLLLLLLVPSKLCDFGQVT